MKFLRELGTLRGGQYEDLSFKKLDYSKVPGCNTTTVPQKGPIGRKRRRVGSLTIIYTERGFRTY